MNDTEADDFKTLFVHHAQTRLRIDAQIEALKIERKEHGSLAKADGYVLGDLDFYIKAVKAENQQKVTERFLMQGQILDWLGMAPGFQADMFKDRAPQEDRIYSAGYNAGSLALPRTSNYAPGSGEDRTWLNGYDNAQQDARDKLQAAMERKQHAKVKEVELLKKEPKSKQAKAESAKVVPMPGKRSKTPPPPPDITA